MGACAWGGGEGGVGKAASVREAEPRRPSGGARRDDAEPRRVSADGGSPITARRPLRRTPRCSGGAGCGWRRLRRVAAAVGFWGLAGRVAPRPRRSGQPSARREDGGRGRRRPAGGRARRTGTAFWRACRRRGPLTVPPRLGSRRRLWRKRGRAPAPRSPSLGSLGRMHHV